MGMEKVLQGDVFRTNIGLNLDAPEFVPKTLKREEDECPIYAKSCSIRKYSRCCVPQQGRITLVQQWNTQESINAFTMHGLWPGDCNTGTGAFDGCRDSPQYPSLYYNVMSDPSLAHLMNTYWPDSTALLWTNQWNKHGTCHTTIESRCHGNDPSPNDAIRYFQLGLNAYFSYDILTELKLADIVPGGTYSKAKFMAALSVWPKSVELRCRGALLYEVRIYLLGMSYDNFDLLGHAPESNCPDMIRFSEKPAPLGPVQYYPHYELKK
ncbi:Ribonuclease T2 precursor (RNase T2) [Entomophthora muscae]|uniref:Ribonuclease T2 (RNase T2) n=1 Tax=Entomophthora muscae TaxID=34485 RepID=A0ACC2SWZ2_9FUNG|nr:Ribonuclease T2 precursor (RNase T2) [Entomophthora muscae]